jgi:hypothetical protein
MKNKASSKHIFNAALSYTLMLYILLSFTTSVFFGDKIMSIVTLNWERYTGGVPAGFPAPWWATALSYMVLIFPVVTVSAAFPLQIVVASGEYG